MPKSLCIKTNNQAAILYLMNELDNLDIENVYFSCKTFKNFTNVIIHYTGQVDFCFYSSISKILTHLILDLYEHKLISNIIAKDYFYFFADEQKEIEKSIINYLDNHDFLNKYNLICSAFNSYIQDNKSLVLVGFINFRLFDYMLYLENAIDFGVNKYIVDKEYGEFIGLLKTYINTTPCNYPTIHLIYKNKIAVLLDDQKNIIPLNTSALDYHFVSDISFSNNDYTLNTLLTLLPSNLNIHLLDSEDDFIRTLTKIFDTRVFICHGCNFCNYYVNTPVDNSLK